MLGKSSYGLIILSLVLVLSLTTNAQPSQLPNYNIVDTSDYSHGAATRLKVIDMIDSMIIKRDIYLLLEEITNKYITNYDIVSVVLLPNQSEVNQAIASSEYAIPSKNEWRSGATGGDTIINGLDIEWGGIFYYERVENIIPDNEKKIYSVKYKVYGEPTTALVTYQDRNGNTQLEKVSLPWEYSLEAKQGDFIALQAMCYKNDPGIISAVVYINNKEFKKSEGFETSMSTSGYMGPVIGFDL